MPSSNPWHGSCDLQFSQQAGISIHQGGCTAPFKLMRAEQGSNGRCELPLLHTAGGLVGGDQLSVRIKAEPCSRSLITSVAAQKVYGSVGRSKLHPKGIWSKQSCQFQLDSDSDLEWLPQELVIFEAGLFEQSMHVDLAPGACFLSAEIVRLGRTAAGEGLGAGQWRSSLEIKRNTPEGQRWELVDRLQLGGDALSGIHGMNNQPVFGSLVWIAAQPVPASTLTELLNQCRDERAGLEGNMACGALTQGLIARYSGPSSQAARYWFSRIWAQTRAIRGLDRPQIPRVWPLQESPFQHKTSIENISIAKSSAH